MRSSGSRTDFLQNPNAPLTQRAVRAGKLAAMKTIVIALVVCAVTGGAVEPIPNERIDYPGFIQIAQKTGPAREERRVTEEKFMELAGRPGAVLLDARSADKYALRHIRGAISLPFTDFTEASLAKVIPSKETLVLIYCNNNFRGSPAAFAAKSAAASLNISTYIALSTYGYTNVYELGPLLDVKTTAIPFEGTEAGR